LADQQGNIKKSLPQLTKSGLIANVDLLQQLINAPWFRNKRWVAVHQDVCALSRSLSQYIESLESASLRVQNVHELIVPARSLTNAQSFNLVVVDPAPAAGPYGPYGTLLNAVLDAGAYVPVNVLDDVDERRGKVCHEPITVHGVSRGIF